MNKTAFIKGLKDALKEGYIKNKKPPNHKFDPPADIFYIKKNYPKLLSDPVHVWRALTGIELIHKEPTMAEQIRIWQNWNRMSDKQKRISDEASMLLSGMTNKQMNDEIMRRWVGNMVKKETQF